MSEGKPGLYPLVQSNPAEPLGIWSQSFNRTAINLFCPYCEQWFYGASAVMSPRGIHFTQLADHHNRHQATCESAQREIRERKGVALLIGTMLALVGRLTDSAS